MKALQKITWYIQIYAINSQLSSCFNISIIWFLGTKFSLEFQLVPEIRWSKINISWLIPSKSFARYQKYLKNGKIKFKKPFETVVRLKLKVIRSFYAPYFSKYSSTVFFTFRTGLFYAGRSRLTVLCQRQFSYYSKSFIVQMHSAKNNRHLTTLNLNNKYPNEFNCFWQLDIYP